MENDREKAVIVSLQIYCWLSEKKQEGILLWITKKKQKKKNIAWK